MKLHNDDKGYAVAFALGAIVLVTIIAMTSYALAQRSIDQAGTESFSNRAYQVAASALEYEATLFEKSGAPSALSGETVSADGTVSPERTLPGTNEGYTFRSYPGRHGIVLKCTATTLDGKKESVSVEEVSIDLANSVYSGGGGGTMLNGKYFNTSDSMIIGPLYLKVNGEDISPNANMTFIDGPLSIENGTLSGGGALWVHTTKVLHYEVHTDNATSGLPTDVIVSPLGPKMTTPSITPSLVDSLKWEAGTSQYYEGDTILSLDASGTLNASGTIYVNGTATVGTKEAPVTGYKGVFTIYATNGITFNGRLIPANFTNSGETRTDLAGVDTTYRDKDGGVSLPQVSEGYCATLISSGPILSTYSAGNSNGSSANFGFCGAMFTSKSVTFGSSLRGSIIADSSIVTGVKIILATQGTLGGFLPGPVSGDATGPGTGPVKELFGRVLARENWTRGN
ncbi:MAG: hypothetical protein JJE36_02240 [Coriobacteriia bacterium]|nr:hypothetical protein [Coriobacteriia bacterium]